MGRSHETVDSRVGQGDVVTDDVAVKGPHTAVGVDGAAEAAPTDTFYTPDPLSPPTRRLSLQDCRNGTWGPSGNNPDSETGKERRLCSPKLLEVA